MQITVYSNFYKRQNSTLRPSGGTVKDVFLKNDCSIQNPTFILDGIDNSINYVKWQAPNSFDRYYYVSDIKLRNDNIYEMSCSLDVLATFRTDIGNTAAYIEYCADSNETTLPDMRLTQKPEIEVYRNDNASSIFSSTDYTYLLQVIGDVDSGMPYTQLYDITPYNLSLLVDGIMGTFLNDLKDQFTSASNCIVSLKILPISRSNIPSVANQYVKLGRTDTQIAANRVDAKTMTGVLSVTIPWPASDFRRLSPFTQIKLFLPFVGYVDISPSDVFNYDSIEIGYVIAFSTRQVTYRLRATSNTLNNADIGIYSANIGYDVPISTYQSNAGGAVSALVGGAIALAGTAIAGAAGAAGAGATAATTGVSTIVNTTIACLQKTASQTGSFNGAGFEKIASNPFIVLTYRDTIIDPAAAKLIIGRPYGKTGLISQHSGFIKCVAASVSCDGMASDRESINSYLNSGFYYE